MIRSARRLALCLCLAPLSIAPALAQALDAGAPPVQGPLETSEDAPDPAGVLETLLTAGPAEDDTFTPAFLAQVPIGDVNAILDDIETAYGTPDSIEGENGRYIVTTGTHRIPVQIALDPEGRISTLLFEPAVPLDASLESLVDGLTGFEGTAALTLWRNGTDLVSIAPDEPLAVGSAFKLGVLKALSDRIEAGDFAWNDVTTVGEKSLPTGLLQAFPRGAPVTLHTAAALMISQSDNTATDMVFDLVGREAVSDALEVPFVLNTRELFILKASDTLRADFLAADTAGKTALLEDVAGTTLPSAGAVSTPHDEGIEWYISGERLCELMQAVHTVDVFDINPGVANPGDWAEIAFKGGSEIGVLNLTTWLKTEDGETFCVAFTLNSDTAIPESAVASAYGMLISGLANGVAEDAEPIPSS